MKPNRLDELSKRLIDHIIKPNTYDYVSVTCPISKQTYDINFRNTYKCPGCMTEARRLKNESHFIARSKAIWGDKFNYEYTHYTGIHSLIKVQCNIHGLIEIDAGMHLVHGCQQCAKKAKYDKLHQTNIDRFFDRANKLYGNRFTYEKTIYISAKNEIIVTCPIHGDFKTNPSDFVTYGRYCKHCKRQDRQRIKKCNNL